MATPQPPYGQPGVPPPGYYPPNPQQYPPGPPGYYPAPPPAYRPPKKQRWVWWAVGGVATLIVLVIVGLVFLFVSLFHSVGPARDAANEYFVALKAHDWATAQNHLSAPLRATTSPADLQATWTRREQADGPIDRFSISGTNINTTNGRSTATVTGTLFYAKGASDPKIITLVKEDGVWKLSRLP